MTLNGIVWGLTALQVLEVIGVNLGPLLATAGIAGVAIGLAAQTIVKDMLNGMLILMEDQFNVGDVVRLTGMTGTVETMTLRRTEVRDGDGTLYVVPNSQITTVAEPEPGLLGGDGECFSGFQRGAGQGDSAADEDCDGYS